MEIIKPEFLLLSLVYCLIFFLVSFGNWQLLDVFTQFYVFTSVSHVLEYFGTS